jgi:hypothetical protein
MCFGKNEASQVVALEPIGHERRAGWVGVADDELAELPLVHTRHDVGTNLARLLVEDGNHVGLVGASSVLLIIPALPGVPVAGSPQRRCSEWR